MKTAAAYYHTDPRDSLDAELVEIRSGGSLSVLILDQTIFYPEGGGQSADRGTINGIPVLDVQETEGEILHYIAPERAAALSPGRVELRLDRERRWDLTVHHSAQHLLSGILLRLYGAPTLSMHLGDTVCTIDVDAPSFRDEALTAAEEAAAAAIEDDCPLIIHRCPPERLDDFPLRKRPPEGEALIRVVEIQGHDFSPCCGTHVPSAGRIGGLRITGAERRRGMTRLSFIAGRRLLREARMLARNCGRISRALKVPPSETGAAVEALLDRMGGLEGRLKEFQEDAARREAEALIQRAGLSGDRAAGEGRVVAASFPLRPMEDLLRLGRAAQKLSGAALVLASGRDLKFAALCSAEKTDVRPLVKGAMEEHRGKGGGSPSFFQGSFGSVQDLEAFLSAIPGIRRVAGEL